MLPAKGILGGYTELDKQSSKYVFFNEISPILSSVNFD